MELCAERIAARLNMPELPVYVFDTLDSTGDECRRRLAAGEKRCLVLAERQTGGRGRSGKIFFSPAGGLYMSLALQKRPDIVGLTCRAAVETAEAIEALTGIHCGIKWVNDLFLQGKKVCGILAEVIGGAVILGVGVNLVPAELPETLEPIVGFLNCGDVREALAAEITAGLLRERERTEYMEVYRSRSIVLGKRLDCRIGDRTFSALATGVGDDGGLAVLGPEGPEILRFGEVTLSGLNLK